MNTRPLTNLGSVFTIAVFVVLISGPAIGADTYQLDPVHSSVVFKVKHMGFTFVYGRFNEPTGSVVFDETAPGNSRVEMMVKADNIDTNNSKRDAHLKSKDFFHSEMYPDITFQSRSVKRIDSDTYEIMGDLMLHGVTKPITVQAVHTGSGKDPWGGTRIGFETSFEVKRSDFEMNFMQGNVGNEIQITVSIEGIRK